MGTIINPVRIRLRYADIETFVEKFAPNVTRGGVFLASRNVQPTGTVVPFEIQLVSGEVVMAGQGKVTWVRDFNPAEPNRPYGMGVQFVSLAPATKVILARILRLKEATGAPVPRGMTAVHATLSSLGVTAGTNGKPAAAPIDTTVDLAAEYGIDDAAIRRVLDRTRMLAGRIDDDLSDLMTKESPIEVVSLAEALAGLPRLLDPQSSRRRAASGLRAAIGAPTGAELAQDAAEEAPRETPHETTRETTLDANDDANDDAQSAIPATTVAEASEPEAIPVVLANETSSQRTVAGNGRGSSRRKRR